MPKVGWARPHIILGARARYPNLRRRLMPLTPGTDSLYNVGVTCPIDRIVGHSGL